MVILNAPLILSTVLVLLFSVCWKTLGLLLALLVTAAAGGLTVFLYPKVSWYIMHLGIVQRNVRFSLILMVSRRFFITR